MSAQTVATQGVIGWCSGADESASMKMRLICARHWWGEVGGGGEEGECNTGVYARGVMEWCSDADESACMSMRLICSRHWREEGAGERVRLIVRAVLTLAQGTEGRIKDRDEREIQPGSCHASSHALGCPAPL